MLTFLLQLIALLLAIVAIIGLKKMGLHPWLTFPLLGAVLLLAIFGIVGATCVDRMAGRGGNAAAAKNRNNP